MLVTLLDIRTGKCYTFQRKGGQQMGKESINLPQQELEAIARCVYPAIVEFYQSVEGQREFAEWKAQLAEKSA